MAEPTPEPFDVDPVAHPGQAEQYLPERSEQPGTAVSTLSSQQARGVPDGFSIDIERARMREHPEPFQVEVLHSLMPCQVVGGEQGPDPGPERG